LSDNTFTSNIGFVLGRLHGLGTRAVRAGWRSFGLFKHGVWDAICLRQFTFYIKTNRFGTIAGSIKNEFYYAFIEGIA
jgi:hypothetical protein|tara:strand:- start:4135 stop:4368 length:234 start_codon:yes stop_codon:yes gene_type:complete